ncbi:MAG: hypothetical protein CM15mV25_1340 [uncultured marine virus]|nr:MAG: hypothetical protein CM15mV25_1340 [uncultured marine virus]
MPTITKSTSAQTITTGRGNIDATVTFSQDVNVSGVQY